MKNPNRTAQKVEIEDLAPFAYLSFGLTLLIVLALTVMANLIT